MPALEKNLLFAPVRMKLLLLVMTLSCAPLLARDAEPAGTVRFQFREPRATAYRIEPRVPSRELQATPSPRPGSADDWLPAWPEARSGVPVEFNRRLVLQLAPGTELEPLLENRPLELARTIAPGLFILEAPDAWTAVVQGEEIAALPGVAACHPVARRQLRPQGSYAPLPSDPHFDRQWHLENRLSDGTPAGADVNARAAWPRASGSGVVVAIADDGVEVNHPDLAARASGAPHFDFANGLGATANPPVNGSHATAVAGLVSADDNNGRGIAGLAPGAQLASWVIFKANGFTTSEEKLMDMFQYRSNSVAVQNHSWGYGGDWQQGPGLLERTAISNAVTYGRDGKGVIMIRSGGNYREANGDANNDGYVSDPRVIAVGAVRYDGRAASYSNPGACLLVAAPSGDDGFARLFTTDRQGTLGYHTASGEASDYSRYDPEAPKAFGFSGTSGSAPQISGIVALMLSVNPELTYRDVQQILLHSARHFDWADPGVRTNGAGFAFSHNVGFGVPDAGQAVRLAANWITRPPLAEIRFTNSVSQIVPDDGLRVQVSGGDVPPVLQSIPASPSLGVHPDLRTDWVSLVDVGLATNEITADLSGTGALIQRGTNFFVEKLGFAALAGASLAIVYNHSGGDQRLIMGLTDFVPIPAVFIGQNDGEALSAHIETNTQAQVRFELTKIHYEFEVTDTLLCEQVSVRIDSTHPRRGDLRITLVSPPGTRSVLQHVNFDSSAGPVDWTYHSTQHFYESSAGTWRVEISDQQPGNVGSINLVELILRGVPITDTDRDGLDDTWELAHFEHLQFGPPDDPDGDGYSNAREQILGTNPNASDTELRLDFSIWKDGIARLSWPSSPLRNYEILAGSDLALPLPVATNLPGRFAEMEFFAPLTDLNLQFFQIRETTP